MAPKLPINKYPSTKDIFENFFTRFKVGSTDTLKKDIDNILVRIDREDFITRFKYNNLPKELKLSKYDIERMIYYKYAVAFAKYEDRYFLLPFALDGNVDIYGRYKYIKLMPYSTEEDKKKYINKQLEELLSGLTFKVIYNEQDLEETSENELKAVILKDYISGFNVNYDVPRYQLNMPLLNLESVFLPYMRTSLKLSSGVDLIRVNDENESEDVLQAMSRIDDAITSGVPFIPVKGSLDFQALGDSAVTKVQDYFLAFQSTDNFRLNTMGLSNGGLFEKQERETIQEQATNTVNCNARLKQEYELRKEQIDLINKTFGLNISIQINQDLLNTQKENNKGFENGQYKDKGGVNNVAN